MGKVWHGRATIPLVLARFPLSLPMIAVVLTWGYNFVSLKVLYQEMPPAAVMGNRTILMWILLALVCKLRGLSLRYPKGDTPRLLSAGFLAMGLYMVVFMEGLQRTTPAEAAIMLATAPVFTFLLSTALKQERYSWSAMWGSLIGFAGVTLVILGGASNEAHGSLLGNLLSLASAFIWAVSVVVMRPLLNQYEPVQAFTLSIPGALPVVALYALLPMARTDYGAISMLGWLNFGQVVLLSGVVAFLCFYVGIRQIGPSRATMYQFFIPPTAAMFQWMIYGRALAALQWVGLGVLLTGVIYASIARARSAAKL